MSEPVFTVQHTDGAARAGLLRTAHGVIPTPIFMPVGTVGSVKAIAPDDLAANGAPVILGNTYHLYQRPGDELVARHGGLHGFASWPGAVLTDSGGFQVFSLSSLRKIREEGVEFRSHLDGSRHLFTPEKVIAIQRNLNSDIMMVLDECVPYGTDYAYTERSLALTTRWAARARAAWPAGAGDNLLFGITQGGFFKDLRRRSVEEICAIDCDGFAIGGLSVGEGKAEMYDLLYHTAPLLPADKPRYLMGVGTPLDIAHGIHDYQPLEGDLCGLPVTGKDGLACLISDLGPAECGIVFGSCADDGGVTVVVDARNGLVFACTPEGTCDVQCLDDDAARTLAGAWRKARTQTETKETA